LTGLPTGNMGAVDRHMTPDVEMIIVGTTSPGLLQVIPWDGKHVGHEAVTNSFVDLHGRSVEVLDFGIDEIIEQDASAALFGTFKIRAPQTGTAIESEYVLRIKIRDGQIARYHLFENLYLMASAFPRGRVRASFLRTAQPAISSPCLSATLLSRIRSFPGCRNVLWSDHAPTSGCGANTTGAGISRWWNKPTHSPPTSSLSPILSAETRKKIT
jgi:ketosteroid isomerase-like protein